MSTGPKPIPKWLRQFFLTDIPTTWGHANRVYGKIGNTFVEIQKFKRFNKTYYKYKTELNTRSPLITKGTLCSYLKRIKER